MFFTMGEGKKAMFNLAENSVFLVFPFPLAHSLSACLTRSYTFFFAASFIPPFLHVTHLSKTVTLLCYNGCIKTAF